MKKNSLGRQIMIVGVLAIVTVLLLGFVFDGELKIQTNSVRLANGLTTIDTLAVQNIDTIIIAVEVPGKGIYPENMTLYIGPVVDIAGSTDTVRITIDKSINGIDFVNGTITEFTLSMINGSIDLPLADEPKSYRLRLLLGASETSGDTASYGLDIVRTYKRK